MSSLREALLESGLVEGKRAEHKPSSPGSARKEQVTRKKKKKNKRGDRPPPRQSSESPDLARAYEARRRAEQAEKVRQKQARLADQEFRRRRNLQLDALLTGRALNRADAEIPRYFEHLGRIRRVLCTPEQRRSINAGDLGVVSLRGRYFIVEPEVLCACRELAPDLVPDLRGREPEADAGEYPAVPDDLAW